MRKRDSSPSDSSTQKILCTPGTKTFIKLTRKPPNGDLNIDKSDPAIQNQITGLISDTWTYIDREHLKNGNNDSVIDKGEGWVYSRKSTHGTYGFLVKNAHHKKPVPSFHFGTVEIVGNEVTWGVLQAALSELGIHMTENVNKWTECEFEIWDGKNQVGMAYIVKF
ncbi:MAG: hypothetical protein Q9216_002410 [Gyalolechia sp. 2 TL-2023]